MTLEMRSYNRFEDIPLDAQSWNALIEKNETNSIFQTYEWVSTWWSVFGSDQDLLFIAGYVDDEIIGFAALMQEVNSFGNRTIRFIADKNSDYCNFITCINSLSFIEGVLDYLYTKHTDWECMQLRNMPDAAACLAAIKSQVRDYGWHLRCSRPIAAPYRALSKQTGQPLSWQYSVRRPYNRMLKDGELHFRHIDDPAEAQDMLHKLIEQHIDRYNQKGENSLFEQSSNVEFYKRLTPIMLDTGWLDFSLLEFNGKPVALHFGFEYSGVLTWYKPSFDIGYSHYSPGTVLTKFLIEYAEEQGCTVLDYTIGDEPFKERFCTGRNYNRDVSIYKKRAYAQINGARNLLASLNQRLRTRKKR